MVKGVSGFRMISKVDSAIRQSQEVAVAADLRQ
jgi:hypothetical protein